MCLPGAFFLVDEALLSISLVGHGHLVKIFITLEPHGIFDRILHTNFQHCPKW